MATSADLQARIRELSGFPPDVDPFTFGHLAKWGRPRWKGKCWEAGFMFIAFHAPDFETERSRLVLAHGLPVLNDTNGDPRAGERFAHCWVEWQHQERDTSITSFDAKRWVTKCILDPSSGDGPGPLEIPPFLYYGFGKIDPSEVLRYTISEMMSQSEATGHCGPWDKLFDDPGLPWAKETPWT